MITLWVNLKNAVLSGSVIEIFVVFLLLNKLGCKFLVENYQEKSAGHVCLIRFIAFITTRGKSD